MKDDEIMITANDAYLIYETSIVMEKEKKMNMLYQALRNSIEKKITQEAILHHRYMKFDVSNRDVAVQFGEEFVYYIDEVLPSVIHILKSHGFTAFNASKFNENATSRVIIISW